MVCCSTLKHQRVRTTTGAAVFVEVVGKGQQVEAVVQHEMSHLKQAAAEVVVVVVHRTSWLAACAQACESAAQMWMISDTYLCSSSRGSRG